ncbi:hypothetical protein Xbed_02917 [Xenorhabdus beddingii]|uniref:Uncharacterized protein n=1 Tax=Xenorhabdus beddingii TaxID=40578 RepID=A0A1Y2SK23_9GAMM|nr:hypothetical protein [Xenorhabdus beddingii]OTA18800.1 hypothetical protein Xbed_02917 [Xenorhabdus beddingii]
MKKSEIGKIKNISESLENYENKCHGKLISTNFVKSYWGKYKNRQ